jgi:hypothetical protein
MTIAKQPSELRQINYLIHDYWFNVEEILFDPQLGVVTIPFERPAHDGASSTGLAGVFRGVEAPYYQYFLKIYHVRAWHVEDRQHVELYDFNEVVYEPDAKLVKITTGIPIHLAAEVKELDIRVEQTGRMVATRVRQ